MKKYESVLLCLFVSMLLLSCNSNEISIGERKDSVAQYQTLDIPFKLTHPFSNPYDPQEIRVDAIISKPDGSQLTLPCFYKSGISGNSGWEARFTPRQSGQYRYYLQVNNTGSSSLSETYSFLATASEDDGFLKMNNDSWYSLRFDSGKQYRGVGLNICWDMESQWKHPYETYFKAAHDNNINFIRLWMCPWNLPLEWTTVRNYYTMTDELENWQLTFDHSSGMIREEELNPQTEDDENRIRFKKGSPQTIIYNVKDIRRFKIKMFYKKDFSRDKIKVYSSADNKNYALIDSEYSESRNTKGDWYRIYLCYISDMPDGTNYIKIEFAGDMDGDLRLANVWLEHGEVRDILDAPGLGRYYTKTADRMDKLLAMAKESGVYLMLTFDYHGIFKDYIDSWASDAAWRQNPYNSENGGPCANPADFFTNSKAKEFYKNKLRYMVARWGYSLHMAVWEFWNEIDNAMEWQKIPAQDIVAWHKEMAGYLREVDPYNHIISTSVANRPISGLWELDEMEFSQHHPYGPTTDLYEQIKSYENRYNKPDVLGEYALSWRPPGQGAAAELYEDEMHNGLWRGMFSPTPILPLTWWWEWHYVQNEYFHFKWADAFVKKMTLNNDDQLQEVSADSKNKNLEVMALKSKSGVFVWMLNKGKSSMKVDRLILTDTEGLYTAKWFNPWSGHYSEDVEVTIDDNILSFYPVPLAADKDMALWVYQKK